MNTVEFIEMLQAALESFPDHILTDRPQEYWNTLDMLDRIAPGASEQYRNSDLLRLILNPKEWAKEDSDAFLAACFTYPTAGMIYASDLWAKLDEEGFLRDCRNSYDEPLVQCPETWARLDLPDFLERCGTTGVFVHEATLAVLIERAPDALDELCRTYIDSGLYNAGAEWAKVNPANFLQACQSNPTKALAIDKTTAVTWMKLDPTNFWKAVEEQLDHMIDRTTQVRLEQEDGWRHTHSEPGDGLHGFAGGLLEVMSEERPDIVARALPYIYTHESGMEVALEDYPRLWYKVDPEGVKQLMEESTLQTLTAGLLLDPKERLEVLQHRRELGIGNKGYLEKILNETLEGVDSTPWQGSYLEMMLQKTQSYYLAAVKEGRMDDATRSRRVVLGLMSKASEWHMEEDAYTPLMIRGSDNDIADYLSEAFKVLPGLAEEKLDWAVRQVELYGNYYSGDKLLNVTHLVDILTENSETTLEHLKASRADLQGTVELLADLTLSDTERGNLIEWAINTPGLPKNTVAWATARAGQLTPSNLKVKVRRVRETSEGMGVT
jgi:hypothetical protein